LTDAMNHVVGGDSNMRTIWRGRN